MDDETMERVRAGFRRLNPGMVLMWRLGLGGAINFWPAGSGRILVLAHTGRRSGRHFLTPLNWAPVTGPSGDLEAVYCVAGFGPRTDWYRNVLATSEVEVWLPRRRWTAVARDANDDADRLARVRAVLEASGFAASVAGVPVRRLDDTRLADLTSDYRLVHLRKVTDALPSASTPGPGDLAWVWAVAAATAAVTATLALRRGRRAVSSRPRR